MKYFSNCFFVALVVVFSIIFNVFYINFLQKEKINFFNSMIGITESYKREYDKASNKLMKIEMENLHLKAELMFQKTIFYEKIRCYKKDNKSPPSIKEKENANKQFKNDQDLMRKLLLQSAVSEMKNIYEVIQSDKLL